MDDLSKVHSDALVCKSGHTGGKILTRITYTRSELLALKDSPASKTIPSSLNRDHFDKDGLWSPQLEFSGLFKPTSRGSSPLLFTKNNGNLDRQKHKEEDEDGFNLCPQRKSFSFGCHVDKLENSRNGEELSHSIKRPQLVTHTLRKSEYERDYKKRDSGGDRRGRDKDDFMYKRQHSREQRDEEPSWFNDCSTQDDMMELKGFDECIVNNEFAQGTADDENWRRPATPKLHEPANGDALPAPSTGVQKSTDLYFDKILEMTGSLGFNNIVPVEGKSRFSKLFSHSHGGERPDNASGKEEFDSSFQVTSPEVSTRSSGGEEIMNMLLSSPAPSVEVTDSFGAVEVSQPYGDKICSASEIEASFNSRPSSPPTVNDSDAFSRFLCRVKGTERVVDLNFHNKDQDQQISNSLTAETTSQSRFMSRPLDVVPPKSPKIGGASQSVCQNFTSIAPNGLLQQQFESGSHLSPLTANQSVTNNNWLNDDNQGISMAQLSARQLEELNALASSGKVPNQDLVVYAKLMLQANKTTISANTRHQNRVFNMMQGSVMQPPKYHYHNAEKSRQTKATDFTPTSVLRKQAEHKMFPLQNDQINWEDKRQMHSFREDNSIHGSLGSLSDGIEEPIRSQVFHNHSYGPRRDSHLEGQMKSNIQKEGRAQSMVQDDPYQSMFQENRVQQILAENRTHCNMMPDNPTPYRLIDSRMHSANLETMLHDNNLMQASLQGSHMQAILQENQRRLFPRLAMMSPGVAPPHLSAVNQQHSTMVHHSLTSSVQLAPSRGTLNPLLLGQVQLQRPNSYHLSQRYP